MAGGLGGLVTACGGEETTTTAGPATTAGATTTTGAATETTAGATTTVSAAAEAGREIKVGCVFPKTGPLAAFAGPFDWVKDQWTKALADGVVAGDGKKPPSSPHRGHAVRYQPLRAGDGRPHPERQGGHRASRVALRTP